MLISHKIKKGLIFNYKNYELEVLERKISSVTVQNAKGQTYTMDIKSLMEDLRIGLCTVN